MPKQSVNIAVRAILARFDGNLTKALQYTADMMVSPTYRTEYSVYFEELLSMRGSSI
jgi:hypothetical protein